QPVRFLLLYNSEHLARQPQLAREFKGALCTPGLFYCHLSFEVKMNRSSKNNEWISNQSLSGDVSFAKRLRELWRDLQDQPRWKYEQLSPVQLLEKSKLHRNSTDIDELARANWFWGRRPRVLATASSIVWL